ncbi:MAG: hypothetical protein P8Y68_13375 [Anaerolineales bacterium]|jgi:hypothetical protein
MEASGNKQRIGWGMLLIVFGITAFLDNFVGIDDWLKVAIMGIGGVAVFLVFLTDRKNWRLLIPAYVLLAIAGISALALTDMLQGEVIGSLVLVLVALPFLAVYLLNQDNWWALIPSWVLLAIGLMVFLIGQNILNDELVVTYVMFSIALPFFVVYLTNRKNWWALIPSGVTAVIGLAFFAGTDLAQYVIPAVLLIAGIWVLSRSFTKQE